MNEKTYRKMTKKRPLRGFRLFKQKYLTKQRFYAFLAKIRLVHEVKFTDSSPIINNDYINKVRLLEDKIETDRGVFNLSFYCTGTRCTHKWHYESVFKPHRRLYTVSDEEDIYVEAEVRSQCEEFEVRLDPFNHIRANKKHYRLFIHSPIQPLLGENKTQTVKTKSCTVNFLNARFGTNVTLKVGDTSSIEDIVKECVQRAVVQMRNYIEGNSEAINERLTGVKADGEFLSPDGQRLLPNCVCHRCGRPVFKSSVEGYTAQCVFCDEDLYGIEIEKVDPERYKDIYEFNKKPFYDYLCI